MRAWIISYYIIHDESKGFGRLVTNASISTGEYGHLA